MEKLSVKKRLNMVRQYLSGLSYDEIAAKNGVSKGTVANVVAELKAGQFPEAVDAVEQIEVLRELSLDLKHSGLAPGQCAVGLTVLKRIGECGLDATDIDRWPGILKAAGSEEQAKEFVKLVYRIQEAEKKTGVTFEQVDEKLHELEDKAAQLEPVLKQLGECEQEIAKLTKRRDELAPVVTALEQKYGLLNPRVKDLEKREQDLLHRTKGMEKKGEEVETALAMLGKERQKLLKVGLSLEALAELSERVQSIALHHHIVPAKLRNRLLEELENIGKTIGLETLVDSRQKELEETEQAIVAAKEQLEGIKAVTGSLGQEKAGLEASIKETREKVARDMVKATTAAKDMIGTLAQELRRGHDEALAEVRRLKDEAIEVGKEVGRYEGVLQANQWLGDLLALVQGEEGIDGKRVRAMTLLVLRGTASWLKHNQGGSLAVSTLSFSTESLIGEVEQWKA